MAFTDDCRSRLYNWKFATAEAQLTDAATEEESDLVKALSRLFGNSGWFDGDMGALVATSVWTLIGEAED